MLERFIVLSQSECLVLVGRLLEARLRLRLATRRSHSASDDESLIREAMDVAALLELEGQAAPPHQPEAMQPA
jgi:hypothetical protein